MVWVVLFFLLFFFFCVAMNVGEDEDSDKRSGERKKEE